MKNYEALVQRFGQAGRLQAASAILSWDMETMMPPESAADRAEQLGALSGVVHDLLARPEVSRWLDGVEHESLDCWQEANAAEMLRLHRHESALSADLVAELARATTSCQMLWRKLRPADDFKGLRPALERVFQVVRQKAEAKSQSLGVSPYDALLDEFDPGSSAARIDRVFGALGSYLPGLIDEVIEKQAGEDPPLPLDGPFPLEAQRQLGQQVVRALGFDFERGRLDVSAHPFTGGTPDDVRITTRYNEHSFAESLMGVAHETGHALYELGLPREWRYQPVGQARGMSAHESQSLIIEMQACRGEAFLDWIAPQLRKHFSRSGPAWESRNLARHYRRVSRSLIRVDADAVTYPAHILLRYGIEKRLLDGSLGVADLPTAWNEGMQSLVGVAPQTDRDGCMQDIHWIAGIVGYFPSYTLGAMAAAQLYDAATLAQPQIPERIAQGDFEPLVSWLREKLHRHASQQSFEALMIAATGRALDPACFEASLRSRYLPQTCQPTQS